jgi:predicted metal-dependent hydrolase
VKTAGIEYRISRRRRKTVEIAVLPDGRVEVAAPLDLPEERIERLVERRSGWIKRKRDFFVSFGPRRAPRSYVPGETQLFLGKQYRLKLQEGAAEVSLSGEFIVVASPDGSPEAIARLIEAWSRRQARLVFSALLEHAWKSFEFSETERPRLCVKSMARRWGSLSGGGALTLNLALVQAPKTCIEYVIFHELCHTRHPGHGPEFYAELKKAMPDWETRKKRLEKALY